MARGPEPSPCGPTLRSRVDHMGRHKDLAWPNVLKRLESSPGAMSVLREMEATGGEPDVIEEDMNTGQFIFCDCSPESPLGRRSLCYDQEALDARKENKPVGSAVEAAAAMGVELLAEEQYRALQLLGEFDTKTSSWIATPDDVRSLGGALFCDRRYGRVFVYHNGAQSYYAARGFRGVLRV
ncbi:MAG: DUF4256 domain-containing protein [Piscinibacter sp.]